MSSHPERIDFDNSEFSPEDEQLIKELGFVCQHKPDDVWAEGCCRDQLRQFREEQRLQQKATQLAPANQLQDIPNDQTGARHPLTDEK